MELFDMDARRLVAAERVELLRQAAAPSAREDALSVRRRLGLWLVGIGLRIAHERPLPSGA